jgi:hypothetical protein
LVRARSACSASQLSSSVIRRSRASAVSSVNTPVCTSTTGSVNPASSSRLRYLRATRGDGIVCAFAWISRRVVSGSSESTTIVSQSWPSRTARPPGASTRRASATARTGSSSVCSTLSAR